MISTVVGVFILAVDLVVIIAVGIDVVVVIDRNVNPESASRVCSLSLSSLTFFPFF